MQPELKRYYTNNELSEITGKCIKTIERARKRIYKEDQKRPPKERLYPRLVRRKKKLYKYHHEFLKELMSDFQYKNLTEIRQLQNTVRCLSGNGRSFEAQLSRLNWNYFVTITYPYPQNEDKCGSVMRRLADTMDLYRFDGDYRMFFTTEPFTTTKGYHNHLVVKLDNSNEQDVRNLIAYESSKGKVDVKRYNPFKAGVFYITKEGLNGINWDIIGSNLDQDGIDSPLFNYSSSHAI